MVNSLSGKDIKELNEIFQRIAQEGNGVITEENLQKVLEQQGVEDPVGECQIIMQSVCVDQSKVINRSEFIAAALDQKIILDEENLKATFDYFDIDNTNYITSKNIKDALARQGRNIQIEEIQP
eukprot:TRINITY_DN14355_c0_g1_i1.p4 TRINITY_DN14355_c0_g1~~TRINITY_DN14355_c0_g1_i1.p4  ORF type:complete len:124 (-),score=21.67 TRINITY_DN14355_c0_g1_i1:230-601(-)